MSSPATLLSIVCYGVQDSKLFVPKGQPDIRHFVKVNRKITRWAAQWVRVDFDGQPAFGQKATCSIPKKGELLSQVTLVATMPDIWTTQQQAQAACTPGTFLGPSFGWTNSLGHALINSVQLDIGGVNVDNMDGRFLELFDELYESNESLRAKNQMIKRIPYGFNSSSLGQTPTPTQVQVPLPFWFSRGAYCNALPLDALAADVVQISVTFRNLNGLHFTESKIAASNSPDPFTNILTLQDAVFYKANPSSNKVIKYVSPQYPTGISGEIIPGIKFGNLNLTDAYLLCEFISLEENEAVAFRSAQLDYRVEQHYIVPPQSSNRGQNVRVRLPYSNPVKDIIWVCQRPDVSLYNAWFLFTRELRAATTNPTDWWKIPWWPDAIQTSTDVTLPAFRHAYSEPILGAKISFSNIVRMNHQSSPSFFRNILPLLHYRKAPLYNRYIYVYPFGLAPGASDDTSLGDKVYPRGASNWEKLPKQELELTMKPDSQKNFTDLTIYAYVTTYNIFRVFGGRGVMLFAY